MTTEMYQFPDEAEKNKGRGDDGKKLVSDDEPTDGDYKIEVVDDTPDKDKGRKPLQEPVGDPTEDELNSYTEQVQTRIKKLTHARHDERRAKEALAREKAELERLARTLLDDNNRLKQTLSSGEQHYVETAKSLFEQKLESARREYKSAYEAGDADAIVNAQEKLAEAKYQLETAKAYRPTPVQPQQDLVQNRQPAQQGAQIDDKTRRWQDNNDWFGAPGQEEMTSFALGLHQKLVNSGIDPRSDEYFERIDARMKSVFPDYFGETDKPKNGEGSKKPTTVVAPAGRTTGKKVIRLTQTQEALAKKFGIPLERYAAEVAKLAKQENSNG